MLQFWSLPCQWDEYNNRQLVNVVSVALVVSLKKIHYFFSGKARIKKRRLGNDSPYPIWYIKNQKLWSKNVTLIFYVTPKYYEHVQYFGVTFLDYNFWFFINQIGSGESFLSLHFLIRAFPEKKYCIYFSATTFSNCPCFHCNNRLNSCKLILGMKI